MSKMIINENKLQQLIKESIIEILQESQYDESIGHWLGNAYQTLKNKWNNFKGDFNAGRNKARFDNRDRDPYSYYGNEGNNFRNFGGPEYSAYRYNLTVNRNANSKLWNKNKINNNSTVQNNKDNSSSQEVLVEPHPMLNNPSAQQNTAQPKNNTITLNTSLILAKREMEEKMKNLGLINKGSFQNPNWQDVNHKRLSSAQKNAIQQWMRFKLNEQIKELNNLIDEIKRKSK